MAKGFRFIGAASFLENFVAWRLLALEGRLGGGKTLMSVALAKWLYEEGYVRGVFANFPIDPKFIPEVQSCVQTVVILDEGWSFADARDSVKGFKGYGAMFRKLGSWMISPSVYKVDRRMRPVTAERLVDLWLLKSWLYEWSDVRGETGKFLFHGYETIFNRYDHRFIPADDAGILETLQAEIKARAGSRRKVFVVSSAPEDAPIVAYDDPLAHLSEVPPMGSAAPEMQVSETPDSLAVAEVVAPESMESVNG
jgi:hypothetical protein